MPWNKVSNNTAPIDSIKEAFNKVNSLIDDVTTIEKKDNLVVKSGTYTLVKDSDYMILADASSGDFTLTLPSASSCSGQIFLIKNVGATGTVTIDAGSGVTVDGNRYARLFNMNDFIRIASNGTNWYSATQDKSPLLRFEDLFTDFVVSGLLPATSVNLTSDISAGQAYVQGRRVYVPTTSHTYTASKDIYVDVDHNGNYTFSEVGNGASAPSIADNSIRLAKVVTDATSITSVSDLRNLELAITVNDSERVRIDNNGNVGIGTNDPGRPVHIKGTGSPGTRVENSTATRVWDVTVSDSGLLQVTDVTGGVDRLTIDTSGNVGIGVVSPGATLDINGGLSVQGGQIKFPAAQNASADANTLDDYEEGTWTATLYGGTTAGSPTYVRQTGYYTKVGDVVHCTLYLEISAKGGLAGEVRIGGLPFTTSNSTDAYSTVSVGYVDGAAITAGYAVTGYPGIGGDYIYLRLWDATTGTTTLQDTEITDSFRIILSATYKTA